MEQYLCEYIGQAFDYRCDCTGSCSTWRITIGCDTVIGLFRQGWNAVCDLYIRVDDN